MIWEMHVVIDNDTHTNAVTRKQCPLHPKVLPGTMGNAQRRDPGRSYSAVLHKSQDRGGDLVTAPRCNL